MTPLSRRILLIAFWTVVTGAGLVAAVRQKEHLNLSATAGGQYPYLLYAEGMAKVGLIEHVGDRNRMPLYPALLSAVHVDDWGTYVERSAWFAIVSACLIVAVVGMTSYRFLSGWWASVVTGAFVAAVVVPKASFVQPELLYYALFFATWYQLCRIIHAPTAARAVAAGVLLGITFLTKASALPLLMAFATVMAVCAIRCWVRMSRDGQEESRVVWRGRVRATAVSLLVTTGVFFVVIFPYIRESHSRFGRWFYNVNSTFFMWSDGWPEAKAFADRFQISQQYPDAPPDQIPGPRNYLRTHSLSQITGRLWYGTKTLTAMGFTSAYGAYFLAVLLALLVLRFGEARLLLRSLTPYLGAIGFTAITFLGYLLSYAWYVQVAYGDRFLLSLFLPAIAGATWVLQRGRSVDGDDGQSRFEGRCRKVSAFLLVVIASHGLWQAAVGAVRPAETFVLFYYNESLDSQLDGIDNRNERALLVARNGFEGVLTLRPGLHQARFELGMNLLITGDPQEAAGHFEKLVELDPINPEYWLRLGQASVAGANEQRAREALARLRELDPFGADVLEDLLDGRPPPISPA